MKAITHYRKGLLVLGVAAVTALAPVVQAESASSEPASREAVLASYERLLPLEGGSNFRDLGGYTTVSGKTVRRGMLFRSGVMSGLTANDEQYLNRFGFSSVVDLRSQEELELFPNHWVKHNPAIQYRNYRYSMSDMMGAATGEKKQHFDMETLYQKFPLQLRPQLTLYFDQLLQGDGPVVVNCAAGQDRTGMASALILSALGVPRDVVLADYLASTAYRRPEIEMGNVDIEAAAETNAYAAMMLRYSDNGKMRKAKPLMTADKTPYLSYALATIEQQYGTVEHYLDKELNVSADDIERLKSLYLQ